MDRTAQWRRAAFAALLSSSLLDMGSGGRALAQFNDPLWMSGAQRVDFPEQGGNGIATSALPTSFTAVADAFEYQGAVPEISQNVQTDVTGGVQFFIVDGRIYNSDGLLIADREDDPSCAVCMRAGGPRIFIAPIPGSCQRYLIISPQVDTDRDAEAVIGIRFGILDMTLVNDHSYYTSNNLTVMGRFLHTGDPALWNDFDYYDQNISDMTTTWVQGSAAEKYLSDWLIPNTLSGNADVVRVDAVELPSGDHVIGLETSRALAFLLNTDRGPRFVQGYDKENYFLDYGAYRSIRGELELHRVADDLLVGYSDYTNDGAGSLTHTLWVDLWGFDLGGLPNSLPLITGQSYPRKYEVEQYTEGTGLAQQDHFGNPIEDPRVCGLEFSPNGDYLYFLKSTYHAAPNTNFGYIDRSQPPPNGVVHLAIASYTETRKLADSELELNIDANGIDQALYCIGTSGVGQYWLGAFHDPDIPNTANWEPDAVTLGTPAIFAGINAVDHRMLQSRIRDDDHLVELQGMECCIPAHVAIAEPDLYSYTGTNNQFTPWLPGQNGFQGDPGEVILTQDFVVETGAILFVKDMTWRFANNARLIIRRGGRADFRNCTLTSFNCPGERWPGIRVEGLTTDLSQISSNHGRLFLKENSMVENAVIGVWCAREQGVNNPHPDFFGGWVWASETTFRNCLTGTRIERYHRQINGVEYGNLCRFDQCHFEHTASWPDFNVPPENMALLIDVNGVRFTDCAFENQAYASFADPDQRGLGIVGWVASFTCTGGMNYAQHGFRNLTAGVYSADHNPAFLTKVDGMDFQNNKVGLYDLGSDDPIYTNNQVSTLDVDPLGGECTIGFFLMQSNRYTVERNSFTAASTGTAPSAGIWFNGPQPEDNRIYDNSFVSMDFACVVEGDHHEDGSITVAPVGLQMLCGYHEDNFVDQFILPFGFIRQNQGDNSPDPERSANNQFSPGTDCDPGTPGPSLHPFVFALYDYGLQVDYHYYDNANSPEMRPECIEDNNGNDLSVTGFWFYDLERHLQPIAFNAELHCNQGDIDQMSPQLPDLQAAYQGRLAELHSAIASYNGTVDGGDRPDLLDAIADVQTWPSYALRDLLLANGPLSDEVLAAAIRREVAMDPWHLTQVLIDNSALSEDIQKVLEDGESLNAFFLALLAQYEEGVSARDLLVQEMAIRYSEKAVAQRRLVQAVCADSTLEHRNDTLTLIFGLDTMHWGERYLYMQHLANGDFTAAHAMAAGLLQYSANEGLVAYGELLEEMEGDPNSASQPPISELEVLAFGDENSGAAQAWTTLLQLGATDSLPQGWVPPPYRSAFFPPEKHGLSEVPLLGAFPNPAKDRVMITYPEGAEQGVIECYDAQGRQVSSIALQGRKAFVELELNGWSEGLYLARLLFEGHQAGEVKFNVMK